MLFLIKLKPDISSILLEKARATLALSLFLLASKKKATVNRVVLEGQFCGLYRERSRRVRSRRVQGKTPDREDFRPECKSYLSSAHKSPY